MISFPAVAISFIIYSLANAGSTEWLATDFAGIGYDLLRGNPEGIGSRRGGIDPGFKLTYFLFNKSNDTSKQGYYNGNVIRIPDIMEYQSASSCAAEEKVSVYDGTESYQSSLSANVEVEAEGSFGLFGFRFSASTGYSNVRDSIQSTNKVVMSKTVTCSKGHVRLLLAAARNTPDFSISDNFFFGVQALPAYYDRTLYRNFLKTWGTHFVKEATIGSRLVHRYQSSYGQMYQYASDEVDASVSAGGSYGGFSASFTVDINKFSSKALSSSTFGSEMKSLSSGPKIQRYENSSWHVEPESKIAPVPVHFELLPITVAFDPKYWTVLPGGATYQSAGIAAKLNHIKTALSNYPQDIGATRTSNDPEIKVPNAWPDGLYSLPQAATGCPQSGNGFTWRVGSIYQDNEDRNTKNICPPSNKIKIECSNDIKRFYCSKTVKRGDYGISWPKGSYCIGKKEQCPSGFTEQYIFWDDENRNNDNTVSVPVPDGVYNSDTRINYCCRRDRHPHEKIILPTDKPFVMILNHQDGCQEVKGMKATKLLFQTDDEDDNTASSSSDGIYGTVQKKDQRMYYCHYASST